MSEPLNQHPPLFSPDQWSNDLADTDFGPVPQLSTHQLESFVLSEADVGAYDWATMIREIGAPCILGVAPQNNIPVSFPDEDPQMITALPLPGPGLQNDAPLPFSPTQHPIGSQINMLPACNILERGADTSVSIDQPGGSNTLAEAEFTMDCELDDQDPEDEEEVHFGTRRIRTKVPRDELPRRRITYMVNKAKKLVADEEASEMKARWDQEIAAFNEKHDYALDYIHPNFGLSQTIKTTRGTSASNGLNSRASAYFNSGEYIWPAT